MVVVAEVGGEGSGWCLRGFGIARKAVEEGGVYPGGPGNRRGRCRGQIGDVVEEVNQPDGRSDCYPRVRREHRQALIFGGKDGTRAQWLCWVACGLKRAGGGPWFGWYRWRPDHGGSLVTRRGREGQGGIGRCASVAKKGDGTEVLRGNRSRWRGGRDRVILSRWKRAGTRSGVGGFGEKFRDRKRMARSHRGGLGGKRTFRTLEKVLIVLIQIRMYHRFKTANKKGHHL